jgi:hypothetical protein
MLEGFDLVEGATAVFSEAWKAFSSSSALTFLLMGILVGFALAMALGAIGSRRLAVKSRGKRTEERTAGSTGLSGGMSA